jgi:hypothetical protein
MSDAFDYFDNASSYVHPKASRALITAGWRDVPHLDEATQAELLAETPPWLREARSLGKPSLGAGAIYPIEERRVKCDPFPIPSYWPRAYAMDVGWNWTAGLWGAWDRDTSTLYIYSEYKAGDAAATDPRSRRSRRAELGYLGIIDPAANGQRNQKDGEALKASYEGCGLKLTNAINAVEAGLSMNAGWTCRLVASACSRRCPASSTNTACIAAMSMARSSRKMTTCWTACGTCA